MAGRATNQAFGDFFCFEGFEEDTENWIPSREHHPETMNRNKQPSLPPSNRHE